MEAFLPAVLFGILIWIVYGCVCSHQKKLQQAASQIKPSNVNGGGEENAAIKDEALNEQVVHGKFIHEENILPTVANPNAFKMDLPDYEDNFLSPQQPPQVGSFLGHVPTEVEVGDRVMVGERRCTVPKLGQLSSCVDQETGMSNYRQVTNNVRYDHNNCECRANDLCQLPQERVQGCQQLYS